MDKVKIKLSFSIIILLVMALFFKNIFLVLTYSVALFLHEIGHIACAKLKGYNVSCINCSIFGMKMSFSKIIHPNDEFVIAIAGPLVNLFICIICTSLWWIVPESYFYLYNFFWSNLTLCLFNFLPISPLDGSIIAKNLFKHKLKRKTYLILKKAFQSIFFVTAFTCFLVSCFVNLNYYFLTVALFFLLELFSKNENNSFDILSNFALIKTRKIYQTQLFFVNVKCTLLDLYKKINAKKYVMFLCNINNKQHLFSEASVQKWLIVYPFDTTIDIILVD